MSIRKQIVYPLVISGFFFNTLASHHTLRAAAAGDGLISALEAKYQVTETTLDRSKITSPGTVMAVQAHGINAEPSGTLVTFENHVVDGKVQQRSHLTEFVKSKNLMIFKPGDKVYILKIDSKSDFHGDSLRLSILTCDELDVDGGESQKRYAATLAFKMPKDFLAQSSPDEVEHTIEAILAPAPDSGGDESTAGGQQESAPAKPAAARKPTRPAAVTTSTAPEPVAAPAPAPNPARAATAAPTQTIAMGQTLDQVVGIMGQPQQIVDLGAKKTYKYKDLKVIFVNGKVSDVQ